MKTPHLHQEESIEKVRDEFKTGKKSVLLQGSTGSGKTVISANIIKRALANGNGAWFLCHRRELVGQTSRTFKELGIPHGIIAAGSYPNPFQKIQICSIQTLANRLKRLPSPPLAVVDECAHCAAKTWAKVINHLKENGTKIIGLTATPTRLDGKGLNEHFDYMVEGPTTRWLIDNQFLSDFKVYAPSHRLALKDVHTTMGDYDKLELSALMDKPSVTGDAVEHYLKLAKGKKAIAFCVNIEHSKNFVATLIANGIRAVHVDGETPTKERDSATSGFEGDVYDVMSNVNLFEEGYDVPAAVVLIDLCPTQSLARVLQRWGRVLRFFEGKTAIILDHAGNSLRHGLPDEVREWSLTGCEKRKKKKTNDSPTVRQCPKCYSVQASSSPSCGACGHVFEVNARELNQVDGELKEITKEEAKVLAFERRQQEKREQGMAKTLDELFEVGKKLGYKQPQAWARHVMNGRNRKHG